MRTGVERELDAILREIWIRDVAPILNDQTHAARIGRAGLFSVVGLVIGEILDFLCYLIFRRKTGFGGMIGGSLGAAVGTFSPEILDWSHAWAKLSPEQREHVDHCVREKVVGRELSQNLELLELTPQATFEDMLKGYRRVVAKYHPDRNPDDPRAHRRLVAINAAREQLQLAYAKGLLPAQ